jgi:CubicO group peptidase (beta-lactamase class C family)
MILGFILEDILQQPLDRGVVSNVWGPLSLTRSTFRPKDNGLLLAPTGAPPGQVHDDNARAASRAGGGVAGHAGAFSDVGDLLIWMRAHFYRWLSSPSLDLMWGEVLLSSGVGSRRTRGWDMPSGLESAAGRGFAAESVGHLGFTGTSVWIDPKAALGVVLLTNRVATNASGETSQAKIKTFRPHFHTVMRGEINAFLDAL